MTPPSTTLLRTTTMASSEYWNLFYSNGSKYKNDKSHKNAWCKACVDFEVTQLKNKIEKELQSEAEVIHMSATDTDLRNLGMEFYSSTQTLELILSNKFSKSCLLSAGKRSIFWPTFKVARWRMYCHQKQSGQSTPMSYKQSSTRNYASSSLLMDGHGMEPTTRRLTNSFRGGCRMLLSRIIES